MAHIIAAWIKTEPVVDDIYRTTIEYAIPSDDVNKFITLATKRFRKELTRTIEAQAVVDELPGD